MDQIEKRLAPKGKRYRDLATLRAAVRSHCLHELAELDPVWEHHQTGVDFLEGALRATQENVRSLNAIRRLVASLEECLACGSQGPRSDKVGRLVDKEPFVQALKRMRPRIAELKANAASELEHTERVQYSAGTESSALLLADDAREPTRRELLVHGLFFVHYGGFYGLTASEAPEPQFLARVSLLLGEEIVISNESLGMTVAEAISKETKAMRLTLKRLRPRPVPVSSVAPPDEQPGAS